MDARSLTPAAATSARVREEPLPEDLALALSPRFATGFVSRMLYFTELPSSNDVAATFARGGAPEGTVIMAGAQTAGRGRQGRDWFSPPDAGLYASIVFRGESLAVLTMMSGVALAEAVLSSTGLAVELKWPNDVVVRDQNAGTARKLAGILAEASGSGSALDFVVVGFGLNVRGATGVPLPLVRQATSIEAELGRPVDRGLVLAHVLRSIGSWRATALRQGPTSVLARWREFAPSHHGAVVEVEVSAGWTRGTTEGIDETGALIVRTAHGVERVVAGELRWEGL